MTDVEFDWDHHNIAHIARHGVTPEEAEQVLANDPVSSKRRLTRPRAKGGILKPALPMRNES